MQGIKYMNWIYIVLEILKIEIDDFTVLEIMHLCAICLFHFLGS